MPSDFQDVNGKDNDRLANDLSSYSQKEGILVFVATYGRVFVWTPSDPEFHTPTAARIGRLLHSLGGYYETVTWARYTDTYSLVGAAAPPPGTRGAAPRARESSSVYPENPSGELYGVLGRGHRGN